MRIQMVLEATATLEHNLALGKQSLVFEENPNRDSEAHFVIYPSPMDDTDIITGNAQQILDNIDRIITAKGLAEPVKKTIVRAVESLITQPVPRLELDGNQLQAETDRVRATRREWLIEQVESGSYAAIERLKEEYGDTVKITVEIV